MLLRDKLVHLLHYCLIGVGGRGCKGLGYQGIIIRVANHGVVNPVVRLKPVNLYVWFIVKSNHTLITCGQRVLFAVGQDISKPSGRVHWLYRHFNTNRSKVVLDYREQTRIGRLKIT